MPNNIDNFPPSLLQNVPLISTDTIEETKENKIKLAREEREDNPSFTDRKTYLDQINRLKQFQYRNLFKKHDNDESRRSDVARYGQQLEENKALRETNDETLAVLADLFEEKKEKDSDPIGKSRMKRDVPDEIKEIRPGNGTPFVSKDARGDGSYVHTNIQSSKDFCEEIAGIIGETKKDYLRIYEKVLEKYITLFKSLSDILSELPKLIGDGKENKVTVNSGKLKELLEGLKNQYKDEVLYPTESGKRASQAEAKDWAEKLGLPESCVQSDGRGGYVVKFDLSPIDEMIRGVGAISSEISSAKYQAWKAGFDAQVEKINNYVQTLSQKYTTANSTYDNLVKVLSSTITSMYDADKEFLKN